MPEQYPLPLDPEPQEAAAIQREWNEKLPALEEHIYATVVHSLCSPHFHHENVHGDDLEHILDQIVETGAALDSAKKIIFYGKAPAVVVPAYVSPFDYSRVHPNIVHAILGIITEACELAERLLAMGKDPSNPEHKVNLIEELGDLRWYYQLALNQLCKTDGEICLINAKKLFKRYPERVFEATKAAQRDLFAEQEVLRAGSD